MNKQDHKMSAKYPGAQFPSYTHATERLNNAKSTHKVPISCMFLSNFEMKRGNVTVWSRKWSDSNCDVNLQDMEFKSLPSGIHEVADDVINFVVPKDIVRGEEYYYGVAYYKQNGHEIAESSSHVDRNEVKMYALGVIVNPNYRANGISNSGFYEWKPNQFTSANEYVNDLQDLLSYWFVEKDYENFDLFEKYFISNSLTNDVAELSSPVLQRAGKSAHEFIPSSARLSAGEDTIPDRPQMIEYLPYWIRKLGPLIFPLWKSCLLNERILILNPPGGSFEVCNALNYCLSIISLTPKVLQVNRHDDSFVRPLFTIGISDIDAMTADLKQASDKKQKIQGYVACTSDEILTSRPELYDKVLRLPAESSYGDNDGVPRLFSNSGIQIKATPHDFELLDSFFKNFLNEEISTLEKERLSNAVEPVSWTQYIIDNFYWWATAGYARPSYHECVPLLQKLSGDDDNEIEIILDIVGYFHDKITNLFNKLKAIIESSEPQGAEEIIYIPPMALGEMDLDCFSLQDHEFVVVLAKHWFQKSICISADYCRAIC